MGFDSMFLKRLECVLDPSVTRYIFYINRTIEVCRIDCEVMSPVEQDQLIGLCHELWRRDKSIAKMEITNNYITLYSA